jgi:hypothetical protein
MNNSMSDLAQLPRGFSAEGNFRSELEILVLQDAFGRASRGRALLRLETEQLRRLTALVEKLGHAPCPPAAALSPLLGSC